MKLEKQAEKSVKKNMQASINGLKNYASTKEAIKNSWFYRKVLTKKEFASVETLTERQVKTMLKNAIARYYKKDLEKELKKIAYIKSFDFNACRWGACSIDWVRNNTWGNCPRGDYRNGHDYHEHRSITGCGYDKLSTLTAKMFNADMYLLSFISNYIEKHAINDDNIREKLGYGIRLSYGKPFFDGGVGISSHIAILKKLGFKVIYTETKKSDYLEFERK